MKKQISVSLPGNRLPPTPAYNECFDTIMKHIAREFKPTVPQLETFYDVLHEQIDRVRTCDFLFGVAIAGGSVEDKAAAHE